MSSNGNLLAPSLKPEDSPDVMDSSDALNTEMTCPLTLDDKEYQVSPSPSVTNEDEMAFNNRRDRGSTNGFNTNQNSGIGHGHPTGPIGGFRSANSATARQVPNLWRAATVPEAAPVSGYGAPINGVNSAGTLFGHAASYDSATPGLMNNGRFGSTSSAMPTLMPSTPDGLPLNLVNPGAAWPSEHQLSVAHSYGVLNEDGSYTRLIRADDLQRFVRYPIEPRGSSEGLIILPPTRVPSPNSRRGNKEQIVPRNVINQLPPVLSRRPSMPLGLDTQMQIDQIIASNNARSPPRREKIYCDKWIHDGTCAFVQVGCKYKHIMPTDKATQVSLGLNHGFPGWFRRQNRDAIEGYQGSAASPSPPLPLPPTENLYSDSRARNDDNWRAGGAQTGAGLGNITNTQPRTMSARNGVSLGRGIYGPIAPPGPTRNPSHQNHHGYGTMKRNDGAEIVEDAEDDEEDQLTFTGRGNSPRDISPR